MELHLSLHIDSFMKWVEKPKFIIGFEKKIHLVIPISNWSHPSTLSRHMKCSSFLVLISAKTSTCFQLVDVACWIAPPQKQNFEPFYFYLWLSSLLDSLFHCWWMWCQKNNYGQYIIGFCYGFFFFQIKISKINVYMICLFWMFVQIVKLCMFLQVLLIKIQRNMILKH